MNPEKQRIAIAKACGWTQYILNGEEYWWNDELNRTLSENDDGMRDCPDYLHDLNAMHDAEEILYSRGIHDNWNEVDRYRRLLSEYVGEDDIFNADAETRAKAFLKTLNLWTDE